MMTSKTILRDIKNPISVKASHTEGKRVTPTNDVYCQILSCSRAQVAKNSSLICPYQLLSSHTVKVPCFTVLLVL